MARLPLDALEPGMILASDLLGPDGKMLLPKGVELTEHHIGSLRKRAVAEADIAEPGGPGDATAVDDLDPAVVQAAFDHVSRRFAVNDMGHPAVAALLETAVLRLAQTLAAGGSLPPDILPDAAAESMRDMFFREEGDPRSLVSSEVELASVPDIYFKIRQVLDSPVSTPAQVADVVSKDTSLAAKLLKLVNSPFYGLPNRIDSVSRAVMVIGGQEISTLALGISAINAFKDIPPELINMRTFWEHSVAVGVFARLLGAAIGVKAAERLFVAGILHDIGRLVLFKKLPHAAVESIYYAKANQLPLCLAEEEIIGFSHPLIGGLLLQAWKFPEVLATLVSAHHTPAAAPGNIETALVHVADIVAVAVGVSPPASSVAPLLDDAAWQSLGLDAGRLPELVAAGLDQIREIVSAFFPTPAK